MAGEGVSDLVLEPATISPTAKVFIPRERLDFTEKLYLAGNAGPRIQRAVCKKFGVTMRTARRYITRVEAKLAALPKPAPEAVFQRVEAMFLETYQKSRSAVKFVTFVSGVGPDTSRETKAVPAPEVGTMATVAQRLAELHGIASPQRVDVTSGGKPVAPLLIYAPPEKEP